MIKPKSLKRTRQALEEALAHDGVSVIISREPCPLHVARLKKSRLPVFTVVQEKCQLHKSCITNWACPAFFVDDDGRVQINGELCNGCAVCVQICPEGAIRPRKEKA